jgi:hypothetical protein
MTVAGRGRARGPLSGGAFPSRGDAASGGPPPRSPRCPPRAAGRRRYKGRRPYVVAHAPAGQEPLDQWPALRSFGDGVEGPTDGVEKASTDSGIAFVVPAGTAADVLERLPGEDEVQSYSLRRRPSSISCRASVQETNSARPSSMSRARRSSSSSHPASSPPLAPPSMLSSSCCAIRARSAGSSSRAASRMSLAWAMFQSVA